MVDKTHDDVLAHRQLELKERSAFPPRQFTADKQIVCAVYTSFILNMTQKNGKLSYIVGFHLFRRNIFSGTIK